MTWKNLDRPFIDYSEAEVLLMLYRAKDGDDSTRITLLETELEHRQKEKHK